MNWREKLIQVPSAVRVGRWWRARTTGYPDWQRLIDADGSWAGRVAAANGGPKVLVATSVGAYLPGAGLEGLLAAALTIRSAEVHALLCDGLLPACSDCVVRRYRDPARLARLGPQPDLCGTCFSPAERMYRQLAIPVHRYGALVNDAGRAFAARTARDVPARDIAGFTLDGLAVGEHAMAGTLRFFAVGDLASEPHGEAVLRRYFEGALLTVLATRALLERERFDVMVVHHGIYVPMGLVTEVCRARGVRVVNWNPAYRQRSFVFSHGGTYHRTMMDEPVDVWQNMAWGPRQERQVLDYLKSRANGALDWIKFNTRPEEDLNAISRELGIVFNRPCIGLLTNVVWDAQLFYPSNAFTSMIQWVLETVKYFGGRPDLQLLIRIHPAEVHATVPARQRALDEIRRVFPVLPPNVVVIPPDSRVSTYAAMLQCNAVIIYGTKTGVELSALGKPVVVAGEAWIRGKGITRDCASRADYFRTLDELPFASDQLDAAQAERARRYAYHFFFRRMIPLRSVTPTVGFPPFQVSFGGPADLGPGADPGLDVICDGILHGTPFVYPAEHLGASGNGG